MLGLPPADLEPPSPQQAPTPKLETYSDRVRDLINEVAILSGTPAEQLRGTTDFSKPPHEVVAALRERIASAAEKPVQVFGIQTSRLVPLQYGGLDYKIPASFLANVLQFALAPLVIGWLGSLYATRQRELRLIATIHDYKLAFPHILNYLPVIFLDLKRRFGTQEGRVSREINRVRSAMLRRVALAISVALSQFGHIFHRGVLLTFRWFVLILFAAPMVGFYAYSALTLWSSANHTFEFQYVVVATAIMVMLVQCIALLMQEWILLYGKEFLE